MYKYIMFEFILKNSEKEKISRSFKIDESDEGIESLGDWQKQAIDQLTSKDDSDAKIPEGPKMKEKKLKLDKS